MYKLLIEDEEGKTTVVPIALSEITIGRKDGNTIRLTDRNVSRFHAKFTVSGSEVTVEDLDSYNGIRINGDRISGRSTIREGDLVEVGNYRLRLKSEAESRQAAPVAVSPDPSVPAGFIEEVRSQPPIRETFATPVPGVSQPPVAPVVEVPPAGAGLVTLAGPREGTEYPLTSGVVTLGRAEDNDIAIDHYSLARNHAKIVFEGGVFKIVDLHSANGVLVNGEQFARTVLKNGDVIGLGQAKLKFFDGSTDMPAPREPAVPAVQIKATEPAHAESTPDSKVVENREEQTPVPSGEYVESTDTEFVRPAGRRSAGMIAVIAGGAAVAVAAVVYMALSHPGRTVEGMPVSTLSQPAVEAPVQKQAPVQKTEEKRADAAPAQVVANPQPMPPAAEPEQKPVPVPAAQKPSVQPAKTAIQPKSTDAAPQPKADPAARKTVSKPEVPPKVPPTQRSVVPEPTAGREPGYYELYNDGNKMYLQNKVPEAIALFEKSIKANNRFPQAHRSLGIAYAKVGQRDKAAAEYRIYLLLAPNAPDRLQLEKIIRDFEQIRQ